MRGSREGNERVSY
jgi:hypothetical protein